MNIELWSDFACPYCYIGEVRFKKVIAELNLSDMIQIHMKSFELDPYASHTVTGSTQNRFARKYGLTMSQAAAQIEHISELGRAEGLDFKYASTQYSNMLDAHRLSKFATDLGHMEINDSLFAAYFTENLNLCDHTVLLNLATRLGLPEKDTKDMLASDKYTDAVRRDEEEAYHLGIHAVPYFIIDRQTVIEGAQPTSTMRAILTNILQQNQTQTISSGVKCGPNGCSI